MPFEVDTLRTYSENITMSGDVYSAFAAAAAMLAESSNDRTLYDKTFNFVAGIGSDIQKDVVIDSILNSRLAITDIGRLRSMAAHYGSETGKVRAMARILVACSHPELIGKRKMAGEE